MKKTFRINVPSLLAFSLLLALAIFLAACGSDKKVGGEKGKDAKQAAPAEKPAETADPLAKLYQAAKAEGEVSFWGPTDPDEIKLLSEGFNKRFPGIKVNGFELTAGELVQRIVTEAKAGKIAVDSGEGSLGTLIPLLERDLIQPYQDWEEVFQLPQEAVLENGKLLAWYNLVHPIAYNTNLVKPGEAPKTWEDLLEPKWSGKILVEARAKPFGYLGLLWGEEKMVDYMKKLAANKPIYTKGGTTVIQQLASGEAPLAVGTYGYKVILFQKGKGAPVDWVRVSPVGASQFTLFTVKGAAHPNAAKLFAGWLATPEALKILEKASYKGSVLPGSGTYEAGEIQKGGMQVVVENARNSKQEANLEEKAAKALGVLKK